MADILKLAESDYTDEAAKVDLLGGGLQLRRGTWIPKPAADGREVIETLYLAGLGGNADIIAELGRIEDLLEKARRWPLNPVQVGGTWLEWGIDAEPRVPAESGYASKRAWVYGGDLQVVAPKGLPGPLMEEKIAARLALRRHGVFENLEPVTDSYTGYAFGTAYTLTGISESGTVPGRIQKATISAGVGCDVQEYWVGIRPVNAGVNSFSPVWILSDGVAGTDASDITDATTFDVYRVQVTFATETGLAERVSVDTVQAHAATPEWDHWRGRYMVLVRAKVDSSTECGMVLHYGDRHGSQTALEEVFLDNTSWKLIELGEVTIPPGGYREAYEVSGDDLIKYFTFSVYAERLSGTGYLHLDSLYLIPTDCYAHGIFDAEDVSGCELAIFTTPDDRQDARMVAYSTQYTLQGETVLSNWVLPVDPGVLVVAGQEMTQHNLLDTYDVDLTWFPRWPLFRGV